MNSFPNYLDKANGRGTISGGTFTKQMGKGISNSRYTTKKKRLHYCEYTSNSQRRDTAISALIRNT